MKSHVHIRKGLDIPIIGVPEQVVFEGNDIRHVALCGEDYPGLKPSVLVQPGDFVDVGQPLFFDKRDPDVPYTSPGRGTVLAVNRGERRVLQSVVIRLEEEDAPGARFKPMDDHGVRLLEGAEAARRIQQAGLWPCFRARPFNRVPMGNREPEAIFVTATDTRPLAADPHVIIRPESHLFFNGLRLIAKLTRGLVHLCTGPGWDLPLEGIDRVHATQFTGPHPSGLPGTHIHHLHPVGPGREVWHIGYQDVISLGRLFVSGRIPLRRVVALAGEEVIRPRLVRTRVGASTDELIAGELENPASCRIISGSVLNGRTASAATAFLGRYHQQVCVIHEGGQKKLLGWLNPRAQKYKAPLTFRKKLRHTRKVAFTTSQNGRFAAMLPLRAFEEVIPMDILPSPLLRSLMVRDTEQAQALGCLELAEEDLALASFLCPAKYDYGAVLRLNLDQIEKEG